MPPVFIRCLLARRYWTCRRCKYRNERTASRTCRNCGSISKPKTSRPAHEWPLQLAADKFGELNQTIHKVGPDVCAICRAEGRALQRDHAHQDGGYPRGLLCGLCNKRLGEVERGNDAEAWLESALTYVQKSEQAFFADAA